MDKDTSVVVHLHFTYLMLFSPYYSNNANCFFLPAPEMANRVVEESNLTAFQIQYLCRVLSILYKTNPSKQTCKIRDYAGYGNDQFFSLALVNKRLQCKTPCLIKVVKKRHLTSLYARVTDFGSTLHM